MKNTLIIFLFAVVTTCYGMEKIKNSDFSQWGAFPGACRYWRPNIAEFPLFWRPLDRADYPDAFSTRINGGGIKLNGIIRSCRLAGYRGKKLLLTVRARGKGKLRAVLLEYISRNPKIEMAALAIDTVVSKETRDYTAKLTVPSWHGEDEVELMLEGHDVIIEKVSLNEASEIKKLTNLNEICTLPKISKTPKIDGVFSLQEWKDAVNYRNSFRDINSGITIHSQSDCYITSDGENLYIAALRIIPPGGLRSRVSRRDGDVWNDESLELVFNPHFKDKKPVDLYQIIVSFRGTVFDQRRALQIGQMIRGWDCPGLNVKTGNWKGNALIELKLPLASVGISNSSQPWGMTIGRNLAISKEFASLTGSKYFDTANMLKVRVSSSAPAVSWGVEKLNHNGLYKFRLDIKSGRKDRFKITAREIGGYKAVYKQELPVKDSRNETVVFDLSDKARNFVDVELTVKNSAGEILFRNVTKLQSSAYGVQPKFFKQKNDLAIEHYPFLHKINIRLSNISTDIQSRIGKTVLHISLPDGRKITRAIDKMNFSGSEGCATLDYILTVEGEYQLSAQVFDRKGRLFARTERTVPVKKLTWVGNSYGKDDIIIPPFVPLKCQNNTVSCVLRDYSFSPNGLPEQICSAGGALLSSPVEMKLISNGKVMCSTPGKFRFTRITATRIEFESQLKFDGLNVKIDAWMEYDGILFYTMRLEPQRPVNIDKLSLFMPVKKPILFHFVNDGIRGARNYFRITEFPKRNGVVWDSRSVRNSRVYGNFLSSLWIGNYDRGLSFFAESERGWSTSDKTACYELRKKGENCILAVNFISIPITLSRPRKMEFGVIATPVRPKAVGVSQRLDGHWQSSFGMGYFNAGLYSLDQWISNQMINRNNKVAYLPYSAGNEYVFGDPELKYFRDEIATVPKGFYTGTLNEVPYMAMGPDINNYVSMKSSWTQERVDFMLWRLKNLFDISGIDGVYLDNTFPNFNFNLLARKGGFLRDDGRLQGTFPILLARQYLKRAAVLAFKYKRRQPAVVAHVTDAHVISAFAFANAIYDGEMTIPANANHYDVFYPAWIETSLGVNWGPCPGMLSMLGWGKRGKSIKANRAMFSMFKLYDTAIWNQGLDNSMKARLDAIEREFGTMAPDARFVGYWDNDWIKGEKVRISYFVRDGKKALMYVANPNRKKLETVLSIPPRYGLNVNRLIDAESKRVIHPEHKGYRFSIGPHDFKVFLIGRMAKRLKKVDINGNFKEVKNNFPMGWLQNKEAWAKPFGTVSIIKKNGKNLVCIKSAGKATSIYTADVLQAKEGKGITLTLNVSGHGKVYFGIMGYDINRQWLYSDTEKLALTGGNDEFQKTFIVKNGGRPTRFIRVVLGADKNAKAIVEAIQLKQ